MKQIIFYSLLFIAYFQSNPLKAQQADSSDVISGTVVYADPRLKILHKQKLAENKKDERRGKITTGRGFRVQIYSGNDRARANAIKVEFMRNYPGTRVYMSFINPQYRVKVGNFTDRSEAQRLHNAVRHTYSASMIVPDIVEINTLKNE